MPSLGAAQEAVPADASPRPIADSIDGVVEKLWEPRAQPCELARAQGVPCFPVRSALRGPTFSVRDSLLDLGGDSGPSPNRPPTVDELRAARPGGRSVAGAAVSFDLVCAARSLVKRVKGKDDVYYLYRVRDRQGERVVLVGEPLDAPRFQGEVERLGRFPGECEAIAAYRREQRRAPAADGPR